MEVVEEQAHVDRRELSEAVEDTEGGVAAIAAAAERGEHGVGEMFGVAVAWFARDPGVEAQRLRLVGPDRLCQQRRLGGSTSPDSLSPGGAGGAAPNDRTTRHDRECCIGAGRAAPGAIPPHAVGARRSVARR